MYKNESTMNNNDSKIREVLRSEAGIIITIISITISVILFIVAPNYELQKKLSLTDQRIEVIESNHLAHIQDDIEEIKEKNKSTEKNLNEINIKLERIVTIIDTK